MADTLSPPSADTPASPDTKSKRENSTTHPPTPKSLFSAEVPTTAGKKTRSKSRLQASNDKKKSLRKKLPLGEAEDPVDPTLETINTHSDQKEEDITEPALVVKPSSEVVKLAYKIVRKCTGTLGGNGAGGAIYGELTMHSMQKLVQLMTTHAELDSTSIFVDIGSGLGKPNLHVALHPEVRMSIGIEMEKVRWELGLHNLKHVLNSPIYSADSSCGSGVAENEDDTGTGPSNSDFRSTPASSTRPVNVAFLHADAMGCKSLDPFTHVYMFDIGFPPKLFDHLAACLRRSKAVRYICCFHGPRVMVERYGFNMELMVQEPCKMHGSSEGHTAYLYRVDRTRSAPIKTRKGSGVHITDAEVLKGSDPLFKEGVRLLMAGGDVSVSNAWIEKQLEEPECAPKRRTRRPPLKYINEAR